MTDINNQKILVDTNIWIYLYGFSFFRTMNKKNKELQKQYKKALESLKIHSNQFFINLSIISEFINICLRESYKEYNRTLSKDIAFKAYRKTEDYKNIYNEIKEILNKQIFEKYSIQIISSKVNKKTIFDLLQNSDSDFNDLIITNDCIRYKLYLLTHDTDFKFYEGKIHILSHHSQYKASPRKI